MSQEALKAAREVVFSNPQDDTYDAELERDVATIDQASDDKYRPLVEAVEIVMKKSCGCSSSHDPGWHGATCYVPILGQALAKVKEP